MILCEGVEASLISGSNRTHAVDEVGGDKKDVHLVHTIYHFSEKIFNNRREAS